MKRRLIFLLCLLFSLPLLFAEEYMKVQFEKVSVELPAGWLVQSVSDSTIMLMMYSPDEINDHFRERISITSGLLTDDSTEKEYIQELKALMTKINGMVGMLKQANEDLKAISVASKNIQGNFDELSRTIKADGKDDQMYISRYVNILESKELVHNETIKNCNSTRKKIESTISVYNSILSQIRREIDIVNDINYSRDTGKQY